MKLKGKRTFSKKLSVEMTAQIVTTKGITAPSVFAKTLMNDGQDALLAGAFDRAIMLFRGASVAAPTWIWPRICLSIAFRRAGKLQDALDEARAGVLIDPNSSFSQGQLGVILMAVEDLPDAKNALEKATKLDPHQSSNYCNLGVVYRRLGEFRSAVEAYQSALCLDPNDITVRHNLSLAYMQLGSIRDAIKAEIQALKRLPNQQRHYSHLSALLLSENRFHWAEQFASLERSQSPDEVDPLFLLSRIAFEQWATGVDKMGLSRAKAYLDTAMTIPRAPKKAIHFAKIMYSIEEKIAVFGKTYNRIWNITSRAVPRFDPTEDICMSLLKGVLSPAAIFCSVLSSFLIFIIALSLISAFCASIALIVVGPQILILGVLAATTFRRLKIRLRSAISGLGNESRIDK